MRKKKTVYPKQKSKRRYNWRPDLPDHRDFLFSEKAAPPAKIPSSVDLRTLCSPVFDQGQIGSCTGNSLAGALEFLQLKELREKDGQVDPEVYGKKFAHVSRLFIYYNERAIEGTTGQDAGAQIRDGVKCLNQLGACRESVWKYSTPNVLKKPATKAYSEADDHKISMYLRVNGLREMKQCLASGYPVAFGFSVFQSFESPEVARTGIMPIPQANEQQLGGHAVLAVGYDDASRKLIVRNSWGTKWGQEGYFLMPYEIVDGLKLAQDFWTIRR